MSAMERVEISGEIELWRIICASQSEPDYSEDRQILLYGGDGEWQDEYILLDGGHCSCYGWEEVEWDAVKYSRSELDALSRSKASAGCYYESEREFWRLVRIALGLGEDGERDAD